MNIRDCFKGLRVVHRPIGREGAVRLPHVPLGVVDLELGHGQTLRAEPASLDPLGAASDAACKTPMRPCLNCAQLMHDQATICTACSFQYGVRKTGGVWLKHIVILFSFVIVIILLRKFFLDR